MLVGKRSLSKFLKSFFSFHNYRAFWGIMHVCPDFLDVFQRYLLAQGTYPYQIRLRTPLKGITPTLYSYEDMLTVNEVFCREDYQINPDIRVVVDMGANIGLSALYFLTRNPNVRCYLYEPVPENLQRLGENLREFADRIEIVPMALGGNRDGSQLFSIEPTGRLGGFRDLSTRGCLTTITVPCRSVDKELDRILAKEERINLVKVDVEGAELEIVNAIRPDQLRRIDTIVYESNVEGESVICLEPAN